MQEREYRLQNVEQQSRTNSRGNKKQKNWVLRAAAVMCCLTLISTYMLSGMYAKFTASGESNDTTRVASFDVQLIAKSETPEKEMNGLTKEEKRSDSTTYSFSITNNSEVAVQYDITIRFSEPLPDGVVPTVKLKDKTDISAKMISDKKEFTFESDDFVFGLGQQTNEHTLTITVNYYDENENLINVAMENTRVSISATARQAA